jgi:hypothetical protein
MSTARRIFVNDMTAPPARCSYTSQYISSNPQLSSNSTPFLFEARPSVAFPSISYISSYSAIQPYSANENSDFQTHGAFTACSMYSPSMHTYYLPRVLAPLQPYVQESDRYIYHPPPHQPFESFVFGAPAGQFSLRRMSPICMGPILPCVAATGPSTLHRVQQLPESGFNHLPFPLPTSPYSLISSLPLLGSVIGRPSSSLCPAFDPPTAHLTPLFNTFPPPLHHTSHIHDERSAFQPCDHPFEHCQATQRSMSPLPMYTATTCSSVSLTPSKSSHLARYQPYTREFDQQEAIRTINHPFHKASDPITKTQDAMITNVPPLDRPSREYRLSQRHVYDSGRLRPSLLTSPALNAQHESNTARVPVHSHPSSKNRSSSKNPSSPPSPPRPPREPQPAIYSRMPIKNDSSNRSNSTPSICASVSKSTSLSLSSSPHSSQLPYSSSLSSSFLPILSDPAVSKSTLDHSSTDSRSRDSETDCRRPFASPGLPVHQLKKQVKTTLAIPNLSQKRRHLAYEMNMESSERNFAVSALSDEMLRFSAPPQDAAIVDVLHTSEYQYQPRGSMSSSSSASAALILSTPLSFEPRERSVPALLGSPPQAPVPYRSSLPSIVEGLDRRGVMHTSSHEESNLYTDDDEQSAIDGQMSNSSAALLHHQNNSPSHIKRTDKSASSSSSLSSSTTSALQCAYCDRVFSYACNRRRHERIHTMTKPFTCSHCPKAFSHHSNMRSHEARCLTRTSKTYKARRLRPGFLYVETPSESPINSCT